MSLENEVRDILKDVGHISNRYISETVAAVCKLLTNKTREKTGPVKGIVSVPDGYGTYPNIVR